ncbi:MAG: hypothetical protein JXJ17_15950 [Anaerolineae bacterium]|nr:hypothetical protein [Anaerolineae bacterium]
MMEKQKEVSQHGLTVTRGGKSQQAAVLVNLLRDTSMPMLNYLAEHYGLYRIPGQSKSILIERLLRQLPDTALNQIENDLIAGRYGHLSVDELLNIALVSDAQRSGRAGIPRLDDMDPEEVVLVDSSVDRWVYVMHGYDVEIDLDRRRLKCGCPYFEFSSRRQAICKHIARGLTMIPEVYARKALIDLLLSREYGGPHTPRWEFDHSQAA